MGHSCLWYWELVMSCSNLARTMVGMLCPCNTVIVYVMYSLIGTSIAMHGHGTCVLTGMLVHMLWSRPGLPTY